MEFYCCVCSAILFEIPTTPHPQRLGCESELSICGALISRSPGLQIKAHIHLLLLACSEGKSGVCHVHRAMLLCSLQILTPLEKTKTRTMQFPEATLAARVPI